MNPLNIDQFLTQARAGQFDQAVLSLYRSLSPIPPGVTNPGGIEDPPVNLNSDSAVIADRTKTVSLWQKWTNYTERTALSYNEFIEEGETSGATRALEEIAYSAYPFLTKLASKVARYDKYLARHENPPKPIPSPGRIAPHWAAEMERRILDAIDSLRQ